MASKKSFSLQEMDDQSKILKYLVEVEKLADEILSDSREIILLDKRRNQNREALRSVAKSGQRICWLTVGSVLIKHDVEATEVLLDADQKQLDIDINKLRSDLKVKVNNLRDMEMLPPAPGMMLAPLSRKETQGLSSAGLF